MSKKSFDLSNSYKNIVEQLGNASPDEGQKNDIDVTADVKKKRVGYYLSESIIKDLDLLAIYSEKDKISIVTEAFQSYIDENLK